MISKDLVDPIAPEEIFRERNAEQIAVDILVNNAGVGHYGPAASSDISRDLQMLQLNILALTHLTKLFLPEMIARGHGRVLNVASTAAFFPGPLMASYYASKAYVLSYSEGIANELSGTGVTVTVLCPGLTASGFQAAASLGNSKMLDQTMMDAATVARMGYQGLMKGKPRVIPGLGNRLLVETPRVMPRNLVARVVRKIQEGRPSPQ